MRYVQSTVHYVPASTFLRWMTDLAAIYYLVKPHVTDMTARRTHFTAFEMPIISPAWSC